jgi:hypothetical protein
MYGVSTGGVKLNRVGRAPPPADFEVDSRFGDLTGGGYTGHE